MTDAAEYCRAAEAYLCRKNEGHLIRIVGPAFDQVVGWAAQGVPLSIVYKGIDRYCERYHAKGPRRRPVRIEFCEPDILELFDAWRRAVGVPAAAAATDEHHSDTERREGRGSLPAHLDRVIARLTGLRAGASPALDRTLEQAVRELDRTRASAGPARGEVRRAIVERLAALDDEVMRAVRSTWDPSSLDGLRQEAAAEIAPFAGRMSADARDAAIEGALARRLREQAGVPVIGFEG